VELAADASSDRSMQTALARRAARILSRDPPHAFLPDVSWRRPSWSLAASAVLLGGVLWMAKGTAVAPWLPGAAAGTQTLANGESAGAPARDGENGVRRGARAAREGADGVSGSTQHAPRKRGGEHEAAGAGERGADARAARQGAGGAPQEDGAGGAPDAAGGVDDERCQAPFSTATAKVPETAAARAAAGPPLPSRNPSEAAPENVLDAMRHTKPLIEGDDRPPEGDEPPRPFLGKMGVSTADDRRYTAAWPAGAPRPKPGSDASSVVGSARTVTRPADGRLIDAAGGPGARPVVVPADAAAGQRGALIHAAEVRVSPRLRPAVRAYFERVGRLTAGE
jgi:hypothetical protein